jgi:hypothetical protein
MDVESVFAKRIQEATTPASDHIIRGVDGASAARNGPWPSVSHPAMGGTVGSWGDTVYYVGQAVEAPEPQAK